MKIACKPDGTAIESNSVDWMLARAGIPTASEFDALVTPLFEPRKGEMPKTYLAKKVAERWSGGPLADFNTFDVEMGNILEREAKPWYSLEFSETIQNVGFITTDDGRVGCSPDGLIEDNCGIEIKCPAVHTHVSYLLKGELPKDYSAQVHGSLYVTGRDMWRFLSYRRHFPPLLITVERDDKIIAVLDEVLRSFNEQLDAAMKRLEEINGGPPRRKPLEYSRPAPSQEEFMSEMPS